MICFFALQPTATCWTSATATPRVVVPATWARAAPLASANVSPRRAMSTVCFMWGASRCAWRGGALLGLALDPSFLGMPRRQLEITSLSFPEGRSGAVAATAVAMLDGFGPTRLARWKCEDPQPRVAIPRPLTPPVGYIRIQAPSLPSSPSTSSRDALGRGLALSRRIRKSGGLECTEHAQREAAALLALGERELPRRRRDHGFVGQ